jgi:hypothetical protein
MTFAVIVLKMVKAMNVVAMVINVTWYDDTIIMVTAYVVVWSWQWSWCPWSPLFIEIPK